MSVNVFHVAEELRNSEWEKSYQATKICALEGICLCTNMML